MSQDQLVVDSGQVDTAEQILTRCLAHLRLAKNDLARLLESQGTYERGIVQVDLAQLYRVSRLLQKRLDLRAARRVR